METDSIFKGLNLSAQATNTELGKSDSPYLRRAQRGTFIIMTTGLSSHVSSKRVDILLIRESSSLLTQLDKPLL